MSQSITLEVKGLHTYSSEISGIPLGALTLAQNVNISRLNIVEPRRGYDFLEYALPLTTDRPKKIFFWNSEVFCHYESTFAYYDTASGFSSRGSLTAPSHATSVRAVSASDKNLYITSSVGLKKTDAIGTSLYAAGIPKGLTIDLALAGAGTALSTARGTIYRYLLGRKDANAKPVFGGVSGRFTINNAVGTTQNVTVTCYIPTGLDTTYFLQLYKIPEAATPLSDEMQLCFETPISATHISNGYVTITDIVPDSLLGATIYTAPTQQGMVNDNGGGPPLARDIAEFKSCLFYIDVEFKQRLIFSLVAVDGTGFVAADTITIKLGATPDEVYIGHASVFDSALKQFIVSTGGTPAQDIDNTIKSFLKCVNLASTIVYGFSLTEGATDLPGKVLIEAKALGTATFTAVSSRATAWQPQLASPATVNNTSSSDSFPNGIMWSKPNQHESVPTKNIQRVGASDDRNKRIMALRDGLFIFKERDGVFVLRGETEANFAISPLDTTAKLVAPDSLGDVNNQIYGLFEAGICEVSDTGVSIISINIKDQLLPLYAAPLANLKALTFGIGANTDGKYICSVPTASTDTASVKQFIFDVFGRTFCTWNLNLICGGVNPADVKLYLGGGNTHKIRQERKSFSYTDYGDFGNTCTISSFSGTSVFINNTSDMAAGDILYQGNNALAYIESVSTVAGSVEIDSAQTWTLAVADVTHIKAIDVKFQWAPDFAGNAAGLKQYYECNLIQQQSFQKSATIYFSSDINPSEASIPLTSASGNGAWGEFTWGDEVWGGEQAKSPKRFGVPRGHAMCNQLTTRFEHKVAYSDFQITGISYSFNPVSTSTSR